MLPVSQFIPFDLYNPKVNKKIQELRCPFCPQQYFGTVAAMKRHRVGCHRYRRFKGDIPPTELDIINSQMVDAVKIEGHRGAEYLIVYADGRKEWHVAPPTHPLVTEFKSQKPPSVNEICLIEEKDFDAWLACPYEDAKVESVNSH